MEEKLEKFVDLIMNGSLTIRQASEKSGYGRDLLKSKLIEKCGGDSEKIKEIEQQLRDNKANSTAIQIQENFLKNTFLRTINGEISLEQAKEELGIKDLETLKTKFFEFVKDSESPEMILKYREYQESLESEVDISSINFRLVAITMIRNGASQSSIAAQMGISPRTISREFEKLSSDKDTSLYDLIKFYSDRVMRRKKLTSGEKRLLEIGLDNYERNNPELLQEKKKSKSEEKIEKLTNLVLQEKMLRENENLTQAQIAERLGVSISTLRRSKIALEKENILKGNHKTEKATPEDSGR